MEWLESELKEMDVDINTIHMVMGNELSELQDITYLETQSIKDIEDMETQNRNISSKDMQETEKEKVNPGTEWKRGEGGFLSLREGDTQDELGPAR